MICGSCKANHGTVAEVKGCYARARATADGSYAPGEFSQYDRAKFKAPTPLTAATVPSVGRFKAANEALPDVPSAHYAIEVEGVWKFYQVDKPVSGKWAGYTFVKVQAGADVWPLKSLAERLAVLEAIAVDPEKALTDYGHQLGHCGICNHTLTNPESIAAGIGPICAGRL